MDMAEDTGVRRWAVALVGLRRPSGDCSAKSRRSVSLRRATMGYSVAEEAPIFVLVFAVPAAVALLVAWGLSRS
jgi:hypothetical protein